MQNPSSVGPPFSPTPITPRRGPNKLLLFGCGLPVVALVGLIVLGAILGDSPSPKSPSASSGNSSSTEVSGSSIPARYFGKWTGQDGTTLAIRSDGQGDFNGGNFKVEGGGITVDESGKKLKISSFFGMGREWTLDKAPSDTGGDMKLSGVTFRRIGGFSPGSSLGNSSASTTNGESFSPDHVPTNAQELAQETTSAFRHGVRAKDLGTFYNSTSQMWQQQTSETEFKEAFAQLTKGELSLPDWGNTQPVLSPAPHIDDEKVLRVDGYYPTKPIRANFRLRYVPEDGAWKLLGINWDFKRTP
ncbi:hypothetical protein IAD21_05038 [Abditibacteriota bacterium]|nr:hypothetical protein IAD21_05038 [Abditibacteriota bacterium]